MSYDFFFFLIKLGIFFKIMKHYYTKVSYHDHTTHHIMIVLIILLLFFSFSFFLFSSFYHAFYNHGCLGQFVSP